MQAPSPSPLFQLEFAIAAHVDQEEIEQRTAGNLSIDAPGVGPPRSDRHIVEEGAPCPRNKQRSAILVKSVRVETAERRPVVAHLVVVPLREHRHFGVKGAEILVEPIVAVIASKLAQRAGDRGFVLGHDVAPGLAIRKRLRGWYGAVGVNVIAGMDEEVRAIFEHRPICAIAAARGIDAPALPCGIARPDERDGLPRARPGSEMADARFAGTIGGDVLEPHAVEDILPLGQIVQQQLGREIAIRHGVGRNAAQDGLEAFDRRPFHPHARRPLGARPDDGRIAIDVAGLNAARNPRTVGCARQIGFGERCSARNRDRRGGTDQQLPSGQNRIGSHRRANLHRIAMKGACRV